ncbi:LysR family transcriptional regulator, partial [Pseudomonas syringae pv. actinidifoliorum]|nr:LysR family transcriptional regulator [Pseudomonas syringae pv. actinidifoliorum]
TLGNVLATLEQLKKMGSVAA